METRAAYDPRRSRPTRHLWVRNTNRDPHLSPENAPNPPPPPFFGYPLIDLPLGFGGTQAENEARLASGGFYLMID